MHKWWARRLGSVGRAISLYGLITDADATTIHGEGRQITLDGPDESALAGAIDAVSATDPDALWPWYTSDITIDDVRVYDPFMGGGTFLTEAARFGADVIGTDLNPVAWFVTKTQLGASSVELDAFDAAFESVTAEVAEELTNHYQTPCPHASDDHTADVMHALWVKELDCVSCGDTVPLFSDRRVANGRYDHKGEYLVHCPDCEALVYTDDWEAETTCTDCETTFDPSAGTVGGGEYACRHCGQRYPVTDAVAEQGGYSQRLYAIEYYCPTCDGDRDSPAKGYKAASDADRERYETAADEWAASDELREYVPDDPIPEGAITAASSISGNDLFQHGYTAWTDCYNDRQLLALATLLRAIDDVEEPLIQEYLLLAFSDMLRFNTMLVGYQASKNHINDLFQTNTFDPVTRPAEANPWGTDYGMGTFRKSVQMVRDGIEYAHAPTDRYLTPEGDTATARFTTPIKTDSELHQADMRDVELSEPVDLIITDPPYYDQLLYADLADYFYVWQRQLLGDRYEAFAPALTPRTGSIVENPFTEQCASDFEADLAEAFATMERQLADDGLLAFTYRYTDAAAWGTLVDTVCDAGFTIEQLYPLSVNVPSFTDASDAEFDVLVVAVPRVEQPTPTSWRALRREMHRDVGELRETLERERSLSQGERGVLELGACLRRYSEHAGRIEQDGEPMDARAVVEAMFTLIEDAGELTATDIFLDLLDDMPDDIAAVHDSIRGTNVDMDTLQQRRLIIESPEGPQLGTWDAPARIRYVDHCVANETNVTPLVKLQFLRRRFERGESLQPQLDAWRDDEGLQALASRLADATGDETYRRLLAERDTTDL